jgi:hypothetical protein
MAATNTNTDTGADGQKGPSNVVQVSTRKTIFPYIEMTKRLLQQGEKEVQLSGLGLSINSVASIADVLQKTGYCTIKHLETSRGGVEEAKRRNLPRIQIWVVKTGDFDSKYATELKDREVRKAQFQQEKEAKQQAKAAAGSITAQA